MIGVCLRETDDLSPMDAETPHPALRATVLPIKPGEGEQRRCIHAQRHCVISCVTARRANHSKPVQPSREKYSASRSPQITPTTPRHPAPTRGAYRDRHGRWVRGAVAAARRARKKFSQGELAHERRPRADERRLKRTAKPCGSGTRCWCQAGGDVASPTGLRKIFNPPATEARGIRLRGEHGISRKPIAQGMPGCSGCTCMLVCASSSAILHTRPRVLAGTRHSLRPLSLEGHRG